MSTEEQRAFRLGDPMDTQTGPRRYVLTIELPSGAAEPTSLRHLSALTGAWLSAQMLDLVEIPLDVPVLDGIPLAVLASCLPYSGAGDLEAGALLDALHDRGWTIERAE